MQSPLLTTKEAAERLGMTVAAFRQQRFRGNGPPFFRLSASSVRYRQDDIEAWLEARRVDPSDQHR